MAGLSRKDSESSIRSGSSTDSNASESSPLLPKTHPKTAKVLNIIIGTTILLFLN